MLYEVITVPEILLIGSFQKLVTDLKLKQFARPEWGVEFKSLGKSFIDIKIAVDRSPVGPECNDVNLNQVLYVISEQIQAEIKVITT